MGTNGVENLIYYALFSSLFLATQSVNTVKIKSLKVPDTVLLVNQTILPLVLDCKYVRKFQVLQQVDQCEINFQELNPKEKGLVLKWYFNDQLFFQWIQDRQPSFVGSYFKNLVDTNYTSNQGVALKYDNFFKFQELLEILIWKNFDCLG